MEMNRKIISKGIALGLFCGMLGVALAIAAPQFGAVGKLIDFRVLPVVIVALFVGAPAGLVAGAVAAVGIAACSLVFPLPTPVLPTVAGMLAATAVAVVARKWMFYDRRPMMMPAALCFLVAELLSLTCVIFLDLDNFDDSIGGSVAAMMEKGAVSMAVGAVVSALFRVRNTFGANLFAVLVIGFIAGSTAAVWYTQDNLALALVSETMTSIQGDAVVAMDYPIEPEMLRTAHLATSRRKTAAEMAKDDIKSFAQTAGYDYVAVVDAGGKVVAASDPATVGFALGENENLKEFLALNDGSVHDRYIAQSFRTVTDFPKVCLGRACKFIAMKFPEGKGFVLIVESFEGLLERDYLFETAVREWHVGKNGSMLLIDPKGKKVISGMEAEDTGKTLDEVGIPTLKPLSHWDLYTGTVLGKPSLVRRISIEFVPLDVCIVIPYSDVMHQRDLATVLTAVMVSLLFGFVALFTGKIVKQGQDIAELRRREDEKRQKDMDLAKSIQTSSLERNFPPGVHAIMRTAREVGGDFYDCFVCEPGKLMLVIADVSGKGIPASLFMMRARTEFRAVSKETDDVAAIMGEVNSRLCKNNDAEMFVTAWIGRLDLATGEVEWASAGHNPPYVARAGGALEQVTGKKSLVLAGYDGVKYKSNLLKLEKGDRLFLYTDGVTEAQSKTGDFYGESRLEAVLDKTHGTPEEICGAVLGSVDSFAEGAPQADDITMMAISIAE